MTNIREDVARAIAEDSHHWKWHNFHPSTQDQFRSNADAAITAAEPHIRRKVIEELIEWCNDEESAAYQQGVHGIQDHFAIFAKRLREKL